MMLSGFERSPGGLGLMEATSKVAADAAAGVGAAVAGACADAVVIVSRVTSAKADVERMLFISTFDENAGSFLRIFFTYAEDG
jgi:hypothetical protein